MAIVLSRISNFSPIHVDDHRDEKNCILHLKKWLACQLFRLIIFLYIESFPACLNFLLQLTRKLAYETQVQFLGRENPLKKGMATHCSILAWRISGTEEPAGCSLRGCRVGHNYVTNVNRVVSHTRLQSVLLEACTPTAFSSLGKSSATVFSNFASALF